MISRTFLYVGLLAIALLGLLFFWPVTPSEEQQVIDGLYIHKKGNFSFMPADGWQVTETASLPVGFSGKQFAFAKGGSACVFAYIDGVKSGPARDVYLQTTPGERIYRGLAQFDTWWWAPRSQLPATFQPQFEGRVPIIGEVKVSPAGYVVPRTEGSAAFLLYMSDGSAVSEACSAEGDVMLASVRDHFEPIEIDSASSGTFAVVSSNIENRSVPVFKSDGAEDYREIVAARSAFDAFYGATVHNDMIYRLQSGSLISIDLFTGEAVPIPGIATSSERMVQDFLIHGDRLWYLLGAPGCGEYMARCDVELYEITVRGGTPQQLAPSVHLESGSIFGFDDENEVLYLLSSFGDAGVYSYTIKGYSFKTKEVTEAVSDSGSGEDPAEMHAAANAKRNAIQAAVGSTERSHEIRVQNGSLSAGSRDATRGTWELFAFPQ